jgi:diguanylate cyclase (GGDEF)-like protein/PAS domain S-box-containing protein
MNVNFFKWRSIKTRVTLFTLAIFLMSTFALAFYGKGILRGTVQKLLGEQQVSTASIIATGVNQDIQDGLKAVDSAAATITPANLGNAAALQALLEKDRAMQELFNAGAFIVGHDGKATASVARPMEPTGGSFKVWDFVATAINEGKATVGQRARDKNSVAPVIGMAAPIRDGQGRVIGALVGVTDMSKANFLNQFAANSYGKTGGYLLVSAQDRQVLASSDKSGVMEPLLAIGANASIERFFKGFKGSDVVIDRNGVEVLVSARRVPLADWYVVVTLPTEEAFAPLSAARKQMLLATILLALLAGATIWLILRRELTPMLTTVKTLATLTETNLPPQPLAITSQDEIAELIGGFNRLLATLVERENALIVAEAELRIAAAAFDSHEGMMVTDANSVILRVNKAFTKITGYTAEEAVGKTPKLLKSGRHDPDFYREMWEVINRDGGWQGEIWDRHRNGEIYPKWLTISAVKDKNGAVTHYVGAHFDITERKQQEDKVHQLAFYDPLTKLPNRRLFVDRLKQIVAACKRNSCHGALMFLDLDNFKPLNDTHGHAAGDLLLIEAAKRLKTCVREVDTVARFGGDEFVVMLSQLAADADESRSRAGIVAEKIRAALSEPYLLTIKHHGKQELAVEHRCTASIGVALFGKHAAGSEDIIKWADAAMYEAKGAGRNLIRFHDSS